MRLRKRQRKSFPDLEEILEDEIGSLSLPSVSSECWKIRTGIVGDFSFAGNVFSFAGNGEGKLVRDSIFDHGTCEGWGDAPPQ